MKDALIFLIDTFTRLYLLILLLRFWLPLVRANFRNPVAQGVLRYTSPAVVPLRRFIPAIGKLDTATVIVALLIQLLATLTIMLIIDGLEVLATLASSISSVIIAALLELASLSVVMFIVAIALRVIFGFFGRYMGPLSDLLNDLTNPLLRPIQRIIPPLGVIDLSTYIVFILLIALNMVLADLKPVF
ncbi:MAG: YggT family protein [Proteobacteria bacterium]|nr:YggT family protein [Pseudomonadota bacterium]MDA0993148.1 YggT family protein [Pseudomonadota bacterium]